MRKISAKELTMARLVKSKRMTGRAMGICFVFILFVENSDIFRIDEISHDRGYEIFKFLVKNCSKTWEYHEERKGTQYPINSEARHRCASKTRN